MIPTLDSVIRASRIHPSRVFNVTLFGSQVYGTATTDSDFDIIMVANNSVESTEIRNGLFNIHVYTPDKFKSDMEWHRINNLECVFAPDWAKLKETIKYDFKLDVAKLRHATSHISSNSWVKARKKIEQGDYYIGIKSLFHSIRIPMFATQIAKTGRIYDFTCANFIWKKLTIDRFSTVNSKWTWEELDDEFRLLRNRTLTEFRSVTIK
jgi:predicted nucleotidyltransferase